MMRSLIYDHSDSTIVVIAETTTGRCVCEFIFDEVKPAEEETEFSINQHLYDVANNFLSKNMATPKLHWQLKNNTRTHCP